MKVIVIKVKCKLLTFEQKLQGSSASERCKQL